MVNLGPEAWDPNFIEPPDYGAPTPLQQAIRETPLYKETQAKAAEKPIWDNKFSKDGPPRCARCTSAPDEIQDLVDMAKEEGMSAEEYAKEDGTYSDEHNMFLCDSCYIVLEMPNRASVAEYYAEVASANAL